MAGGPVAALTPDALRELVLTLSGMIEATLKAPPEERAVAEQKLSEALVSERRFAHANEAEVAKVWHWPTLEAYSGILKVPRIMATCLSILVTYKTVQLDKFDLDSRELNRVIGPAFWDETLNYAGYAARSSFWWRQGELIAHLELT